ncbi:hypothetical protein ASE73_02500 [Sphingomonas sp. Leaf24]|uniref:hypothetical protein n=1 Tax=unclassified Sphingomonas TaxID=196159 RepID=UPI0006FE5846|nr:MULTISPECIES: hypothetical protein [unclassified Sphingomonas]KQM23113.1 hypothetical protein ASE50_02500 [Sphingomonas sp. Leaf5]KQM95971.1 hypothetical protein ASE73_02500 [Sphingomonas sp. Leaf24]
MTGVDLPTILRAIQIVGKASEAGRALLDGFKAMADTATREALDREFASACERSDALHRDVQAMTTRSDR